MVFNTTFNHILVISWRTVLFVEETGIRENHCRRQTLSHKVVYNHLAIIQNIKAVAPKL